MKSIRIAYSSLDHRYHLAMPEEEAMDIIVTDLQAKLIERMQRNVVEATTMLAVYLESFVPESQA